MASVKEIEGLLTGIPPVQYVAAGSCGVKYVSKGLEIVCCRAGKAEFTTLASDPLDNKVYQSGKCRFHKTCTDDTCAVQGPAFVECKRLGDDDGMAQTQSLRCSARPKTDINKLVLHLSNSDDSYLVGARTNSSPRHPRLTRATIPNSACLREANGVRP